MSIILIFIWDPFKLFDYNGINKKSIVEINREMIATKAYLKNREAEKFNSFIFGNSRSQAFKLDEWEKYLKNNAKTFHFDASAESIWGISKKLDFIDKKKDSIKNVLLIIDRPTLKQTKPKKGHLFVAMPNVSKNSWFDYYSTFFKAATAPKFLISYIDYSIFETKREYMSAYIKDEKYFDTYNTVNSEVYNGLDDAIKKDSVGYYKDLIEKGIFSKRKIYAYKKLEVTSAEIKILKKIKFILNKHKTNYKIIISPLFDQIPIEKEQIELLNSIFGKQKVYNFSGKNKFTHSISNYYEWSHYRKNVADEIMRIIYSTKFTKDTF